MTEPIVTRRRFLTSSTLGVATALAAPSLLPGCAPDPATTLRGLQSRDALVEWLVDPENEGLPDGVTEAFASGLSERELVAALFLAGLRRFTFGDPAGEGMHVVYATHAAHELSLRSPPAERMDLLLWATELRGGAPQRGRARAGVAPSRRSRAPRGRRRRGRVSRRHGWLG